MISIFKYLLVDFRGRTELGEMHEPNIGIIEIDAPIGAVWLSVGVNVYEKTQLISYAQIDPKKDRCKHKFAVLFTGSSDVDLAGSRFLGTVTLFDRFQFHVFHFPPKAPLKGSSRW